MSPSVRNPNNKDENHYISRAGWYSLRYPSSWIAEEGKECTTFFDPENGVGALQVSAYETPSRQNPKEVLIETLSDQHIAFDEEKLITQSDEDRSAASYEYTIGSWFKRLWFVCEHEHLLMITYNRKEELPAKEDELVERIVDSLTIKPKLTC